MKRDTIVETIALILAILFVYSSLEKIIHITSNMRNFNKYPILSIYPRVSAILLPLSELILIYVLMTKRKAGLLASAIMMLIFTGYIIYMKNTMEHLPCPCGGFISKLNWSQHIVFNTILAVLAGVGTYLDKNLSVSSKKQTTILNVGA